jgi:hypothetical protein
MRLTDSQRSGLVLEASRAAMLAEPNLSRSSSGVELSDDERAELLAKCIAGELVELFISFDAYEQRDGEPNRAFVKLAPGALAAAAKSAKGRPFLRDHMQSDSLARGGAILESASVKRADGDYVIRMTVRLTAPWAVELALRDLLSFISIGLRPTGPVRCSCCGTEVFTQCLHLKGEVIEGKPGAEPKICEWIYTSAEIVEASAVNVPAVPGAQIDSIRAALSAAIDSNRGTTPQGKDNRMNLAALLLPILSLAATAGEHEILSAVETQGKRVKALEAEIKIKTQDLSVAQTERDALLSEKNDREAKSFTADAIALGQITPADEGIWSAMYASDKTKAVELMSARKPGSATPVGAKRQTSLTPPADPALETAKGNDKLDASLSAVGVNLEAARGFAAFFGAKNPDAALSAALDNTTEG